MRRKVREVEGVRRDGKAVNARQESKASFADRVRLNMRSLPGIIGSAGTSMPVGRVREAGWQAVRCGGEQWIPRKR